MFPRILWLTAKLDTGFNIEIDFPISPHSGRMLAWCIDVLSYVYCTDFCAAKSLTCSHRKNLRKPLVVCFWSDSLFYFIIP